MNQHSPLSASGSLLERAAELYGFGVPAVRPVTVPPPEPEPELKRPEAEPTPEIVLAEPKPKPATRPARSGRTGAVDRARLREAALIEPDAPVGPLAEEFRIVKRQLLLTANAATELPPEKRRVILLCSAQPDEGKTFCALNLALSLAGEKDTEVLLVDADFPKPEILSILGLDDGPGLVDAIADPGIDPESLVVRTDLKGLSVLAAGRQADNVTELLASERTREVLERLSEANPKRLIIFDSPPALVASPATFLAAHSGQLVMVVRADKTTEAELRDALELLSGCERVSLLLNGTGFAAGGRRFGAYYGYGQ
jgi:exopolysaccharide/PEP-CTERM locus tyrosine autokinase